MDGRVRLYAGMLLTVTSLCTAALFACAGGNAVEAFAQKQARTEATQQTGAQPQRARRARLRACHCRGRGTWRL